MKTSSRRKTKVKPREELPFGERRKKSAIDDIKGRSNYYDHQFDTMVHKIHQGGFCVLSQSDHVIMTTLGSCIAVCMYDPVVRVGGMNHFLLPEEKGVERKNSYCMRYGNNAMEILINEIMKRGGDEGPSDHQGFWCRKYPDHQGQYRGKEPKFPGTLYRR